MLLHLLPKDLPEYSELMTEVLHRRRRKRQRLLASERNDYDGANSVSVVSGATVIGGALEVCMVLLNPLENLVLV